MMKSNQIDMIVADVVDEFKRSTGIDEAFIGFDVDSLLEILGYRLILSPINDKNARGFAARKDDYKFIFVNSLFNKRMQLFTILHEVWHLNDYVRTNYPELVEGDEAERAADLFAAAILLPKNKLKSNIETFKKHNISEVFFHIADVSGSTYESVLIELKKLKVDVREIEEELENIEVKNIEGSFATETEQKLIKYRDACGIPKNENDVPKPNEKHFMKYNILKDRYPNL